MRRVIINADDFGLSPGVNRGIVEAFQNGVLTSTTLLCNLDGFDDAVEQARRVPELPVGVHLSLLWGAPVGDPTRIPSLIDGQGQFPRSLGTLARRYALGRLAPEEVRREFRAQLRRVVDAGLEPTHADTHKHVHCLPGVLEATMTVLREFGIDRLRCPVERPLSESASRGAPRVSWKSRIKRDLVGFLARNHRRRMTASGFRTPDAFVGIAYQQALNADTFRFILQRVADGVTEIMCHPGYADEAAQRLSASPPDREEELRGLVSPEVAEEIRVRSIELISYREL